MYSIIILDCLTPSYAERYFHHRFCFTVIVEQNFYQLYFVTGIDFVCFGKAGGFFSRLVLNTVSLAGAKGRKKLRPRVTNLQNLEKYTKEMPLVTSYACAVVFRQCPVWLQYTSFLTPEPTFHLLSGFQNEEVRLAQIRRALGSRMSIRILAAAKAW